MSNLILALSL